MSSIVGVIDQQEAVVGEAWDVATATATPWPWLNLVAELKWWVEEQV